jgi:hypothetical protein
VDGVDVGRRVAAGELADLDVGDRLESHAAGHVLAAGEAQPPSAQQVARGQPGRGIAGDARGEVLERVDQ